MNLKATIKMLLNMGYPQISLTKNLFFAFVCFLTSLPCLARIESKVLLTEDGTVLYSYPTTWTEEEYIVPDGVRRIYKEAFKGTKVKRIVLPWTIKEIEEEAFSQCNVTSVSMSNCPLEEGKCKIGGTKLKIGKKAFYMANFSDLVFLEGISSIENEAFGLLSLNSVSNIPLGIVEQLKKDEAFYLTSANRFILPADFDFTYPNSLVLSLFSFSDLEFSGTPKNCVVKDRMCLSPDRKKLLYVFPRQYGAELKIPSSVTTIGPYAFSSYNWSGNLGYIDKNFGYIHIGQNVRTVEPFAFSECRAVAVKFHGPEIVLGNDAFFRSKINYIDLSQTDISELPERTFMGMRGDGILLPQTLRKCGKACFEGYIEDPDAQVIGEVSEGKVQFAYAPSPVKVDGLESRSYDGYHSPSLYPLIQVYEVQENLVNLYHSGNNPSFDPVYTALEDKLLPFMLNYGSSAGIQYSSFYVLPGDEYAFFGDVFKVGNLEVVSSAWSVHPYSSKNEDDEYRYASINDDGILSISNEEPPTYAKSKFICRYTVTDQNGVEYRAETRCEINKDRGITAVNTVPDDSTLSTAINTLPHGVYDLHGRRCGLTTEGLPKGLYIVSDSRGVRKVIVR